VFTRVKATNYRCFGEVDVPLRPLTVLVGPNDTGKSTFLRLLLTAAGQQYVTKDDHRRAALTAPVSIEAFTSSGHRRALQHVNGQSEVRSDLTLRVGFFQLHESRVSAASAGVADTAGPPDLSRAGENVPSLLDYFLRRDLKRFLAVTDDVRRLIPGCQSIEIATPDASARQIWLQMTEGRFAAEQMSTGVRLMLFFLALLHHPSPPDVVLLEEPENGVHPRRLTEIMSALRDVIAGRYGSETQVVITTHSPYLLDEVKPDSDQVLVFSREEDGTRSVKSADAGRLATFLDEFMLGEVWFNQGEAGLVKKA
jgi:predicted ATPase